MSDARLYRTYSGWLSKAALICAMPSCMSHLQGLRRLQGRGVYCSREHQLADWPAHKAECKARRRLSGSSSSLSRRG